MRARIARDGPTEVRSDDSIVPASTYLTLPTVSEWQVPANSTRKTHNALYTVGEIDGPMIVKWTHENEADWRAYENRELPLAGGDSHVVDGITYQEGAMCHNDHEKMYLAYSTAVVDPIIPPGQDTLVRPISNFLMSTFTEHNEYLEQKNFSTNLELWRRYGLEWHFSS